MRPNSAFLSFFAFSVCVTFAQQVSENTQLDFGPYGRVRQRFDKSVPYNFSEGALEGAQITELSAVTSVRPARIGGISLSFGDQTFEAGNIQVRGRYQSESFKLGPNEQIIAVNVSNSSTTLNFVQFHTDKGRISPPFGGLRRSQKSDLIKFHFPLRYISGDAKTLVMSIKFHTGPPLDYCLLAEPPTNGEVLCGTRNLEGLCVDTCLHGYEFSNHETSHTRVCEYSNFTFGKWSDGLENCTEICGDGLIVGEEECDGSDVGDAVCPGAGAGSVSCSPLTCTLDYSACDDNTRAEDVCGDGKVTGPDEVCDGDNLNGKKCRDFKFDIGTLKCEDCRSFNTSECFRCGDGVIDGSEQCEEIPHSFANQTCESYDSKFFGGMLTCENCQINTEKCEFCGDGKVNLDFEACDGDSLTFPKNCSEQDSTLFRDGFVTCGSDCLKNISACVPLLNESKGGDPSSQRLLGMHLWLLIGLLVAGTFFLIFGAVFYRYRKKNRESLVF